jgi:hypothetical protein
MSKLVEFLENTPEVDNEEYYNQVNEHINNEFPDCSFSICLDNSDLKNLDIPFTTRRKIRLIDTNISSSNYYYSNVPENIVKRMKRGIYVSQINNTPITLRHILNTLSNSKHFKGFKGRDDHRFLESINKVSEVDYELWFGS